MTPHDKLLAFVWFVVLPLLMLALWLLPSEVHIDADGEVTMGTTEPADTVEVACYTFRIDGKLEYGCTDLGTLTGGE